MKFTLAFAVLVIYSVVAIGDAGPTEKSTVKPAVTSTKDVKDAIKNAKDTSKAKKECLKACTLDHNPICVHDPSDAKYKPRTFANECALEVQNCEAGTKLTVKSKGACPGSDGVTFTV